MKIKELYKSEQNRNRRIYNINKVKSKNIKITMDPIRKLKEIWVYILVAVVIVFAFLLIDIKPMYFLLAFLMFVVIISLFIFGNKASIKCSKEGILIKQGFQTTSIDYSRLRCVYIGKVSNFGLIIPANIYNLIIRYENNFSRLHELEFSVLCAKQEEIEKFINNFEVEAKTVEDNMVFEKRKRIKGIINITCTTIIVAVIVLYFIAAGYITFK